MSFNQSLVVLVIILLGALVLTFLPKRATAAAGAAAATPRPTAWHRFRVWWTTPPVVAAATVTDPVKEQITESELRILLVKLVTQFTSVRGETILKRAISLASDSANSLRINIEQVLPGPFNNLEEAIPALIAELRSKIAAMNLMRDERDNVLTEKAGFTRQIADLSAQVAELNGKLTKRDTDHAEEIGLLNAKHARRETELEAQKTELADRHTRRETELQALSQEITARHARQEAELQDKIRELTDKVTTLKKTVDDNDKYVTDSKTKMVAFYGQVDKLLADLTRLKQSGRRSDASAMLDGVLLMLGRQRPEKPKEEKKNEKTDITPSDNSGRTRNRGRGSNPGPTKKPEGEVGGGDPTKLEATTT